MYVVLNIDIIYVVVLSYNACSLAAQICPMFAQVVCSVPAKTPVWNYGNGYRRKRTRTRQNGALLCFNPNITT